VEPAIVALIVAAGRGERMYSAAGPKQYRLLAGKPVLLHSLEVFLDHPLVTHVQVVIHGDDAAPYAQLAPKCRKLLDPVTGGRTRQQSVHAGLEAISRLEPETVLIHDAARPFPAAALIDELIHTTCRGTGALPAHPVADTLKKVDEGMVTGTVDRRGLWAAQTPQCFRFADISAAHRRFADSDQAFSDDASIAEAAGIAVRLVEAPEPNFKITTEHDMNLAQMMMISGQSADIRTGNGYDVHRTGPGDTVVLCGVSIPSGFSLVGHSDADVGLHALTDALLATVAAGDIGSHFPPDDPHWKGAASKLFLGHAAQLVREAGGTINHLDVTLICEKPKIGAHRDAMRARIAGICGISQGHVSVKATTNEAIGFIGRGEGVAAIATATARFGWAAQGEGHENG
jgi:2-C-methyl-D-erythritol 4-phosphate cytidylyltransferase / 2-C-methyl-D-erythritol 2,4-cyclodiphosphate synthase